ncbi:MAG: MarR family transcriptional regulator [Mucilaginibacter polytrichastri]|nr:MarR family transcriptional regulator [Mucilaginibacter polytrichastri]
MRHQETIDYFLKIVWQSIANRYNQIAAGIGLTQSTGYLLINIDEIEGTSVSQIAALLGLKSTSLSRMLSSLEKQNLIYRESGLDDKRLVKIYLTSQGREKRQAAKAVVKEFNEYLNTHIDDATKTMLTDALKHINQLTLDYKPQSAGKKK